MRDDAFLNELIRQMYRRHGYSDTEQLLDYAGVMSGQSVSSRCAQAKLGEMMHKNGIA